jgi:hypothetical protein
MPLVGIIFGAAIVAFLVYVLRKGIDVLHPPASKTNRRIQERRESSQETPVSHLRGDAFEDFVGGMTFGNSNFEMIYRTASYQETQHRYDPNVMNPDFKYRCRASMVNGRVEWCEWEQLLRYRRVNAREPVFIAIGLGGEPSRPNRLFVIPLDALQYTGVFLYVIEPYEVYPERPLTSEVLWGLAVKR